MNSPIVKLMHPVFQDYPGKISACIWVHSCNLKCVTCYNKPIVLNTLDSIDENKIFALLKEHYPKFLNGIVISGGEPMLHQIFLCSLINIIKYKYPEIKFKLDSNLLINNTGLIDLVDGVSFSIKKVYTLYNIKKNLSLISKKEFKELRILISKDIDYIMEIKSISEYIPDFNFIRISKAQYVNKESNFNYFEEVSDEEFNYKSGIYQDLLGYLGYKGEYL